MAKTSGRSAPIAKAALTILCCIVVGCTFRKAEPKQSLKAVPPIGIQVGTRAPEIEGEDIQGTKFKLSDYRGKVVMLDFWGNW